MVSPGFDKTYYLTEKLAQLRKILPDWGTKGIDDVEAAINQLGISAEEHYHQYGWKEGLNPNSWFDSGEYILFKAKELVQLNGYANIDAAQEAFLSSWNGSPFAHYLHHGAHEGRDGLGINPANAFDSAAYLNAKLVRLQTEDSATYGDWTVKDLAATLAGVGLTPLDHYRLYGKAENITATAVAAGEQVTESNDFTFDALPIGQELTSAYTFDNVTVRRMDVEGVNFSEANAPGPILTIDMADKMVATLPSNFQVNLFNRTPEGVHINVDIDGISGLYIDSVAIFPGSHSIPSHDNAIRVNGDSILSVSLSGWNNTRLSFGPEGGGLAKLTTVDSSQARAETHIDMAGLPSSFLAVTLGPGRETISTAGHTSLEGKTSLMLESAATGDRIGFAASLQTGAIGAADVVDNSKTFDEVLAAVAAADTAGKDNISWFVYKDDTWVYVNHGNDTTVSNDDEVVHLLGVHNLQNSTISAENGGEQLLELNFSG